jgi:hypothetical protein
MKSLLLNLLLFFLGCGKPVGEGGKKVTISPDQIDYLLRNQHFECASVDGGRCPSGLARIYILNREKPSETELCSGFLVTSNRMVTNHHCVSTKIQCEGTYVSVYIDGHYETARCVRLIQARDDGKPLNQKEIDYSVFELDRHIRNSEVFPIARRDSQAGDMLSAWVVDHLDMYKGRITELQCLIRRRASSIELKGCPAISGNSGSPVTNLSGEVVGVLWGSTTSGEVSERTPLHQRRQMENEYSFVTDRRHFRAAIMLE